MQIESLCHWKEYAANKLSIIIFPLEDSSQSICIRTSLAKSMTDDIWYNV